MIASPWVERLMPEAEREAYLDSVAKDRMYAPSMKTSARLGWNVFWNWIPASEVKTAKWLVRLGESLALLVAASLIGMLVPAGYGLLVGAAVVAFVWCAGWTMAMRPRKDSVDVDGAINWSISKPSRLWDTPTPVMTKEERDSINSALSMGFSLKRNVWPLVFRLGMRRYLDDTSTNGAHVRTMLRGVIMGGAAGLVLGCPVLVAGDSFFYWVIVALCALFGSVGVHLMECIVASRDELRTESV